MKVTKRGGTILTVRWQAERRQAGEAGVGKGAVQVPGSAVSGGKMGDGQEWGGRHTEHVPLAKLFQLPVSGANLLRPRAGDVARLGPWEGVRGTRSPGGA